MPDWRRIPRRAELALLAGTLLLALGLRLPHLTRVPQFTDESLEVLWSLPIARGEVFPLTNYDAYYGALFNYLVAAAFALLGPSPLAARLVVLTAGLLTVLATYALARAWNGPAAGLLAAALMAVNAVHVAISSHVAWANCTTPLFTTLAVWLTWRGVVRPLPPAPSPTKGGGSTPPPFVGEGGRGGEVRPANPASLVPAGLLWGLALQTHPLVATLLPAAATYVLWRGRHLLRTPWPYLAALAFLVGYGNMIAHNLGNHFESLIAADRIRYHYGREEDAAPSYPAALGSALLLLGRVLGGALDGRDSPWLFLLHPLVLPAAALGVAGLVREARRGNPLPLLLVVSCLALLPAFNPKFRTLITSRYVMPLVPILLAASAGLLVACLGRLANHWWTGPSDQAGAADRPRSDRRWLAAAPLALGVALLAWQPAALAGYYARAYAAEETNERIYRLEAWVAQHGRPREPLILDESFGSESGGDELRALRYLLAFRETPTVVMRVSSRRLEEELEASPSLLLILNGRQVRDLGRIPLQPLTPLPERGSDLGLFRLQHD